MEKLTEYELSLVHQEGGNSITRRNMLEDPHYVSYCGAAWVTRCSMPRTNWNKELGQFKCPECGWVSGYPEEFIKYYRSKWKI